MNVSFYNSIATRTALTALQNSNSLVPGAIYFLQNDQEIWLATSVSTMDLYSVGSGWTADEIREYINSAGESIDDDWGGIIDPLDQLLLDIADTKDNIAKTTTGAFTLGTDIATASTANALLPGGLNGITSQVNGVSTSVNSLRTTINSCTTGSYKITAGNSVNAKEITTLYNFAKDAKTSAETALNSASAAYVYASQVLTAAYAKETEIRNSVDNALKFLGFIGTGTNDYKITTSSQGVITITKSNGTAITPKNGDVILDPGTAKEYIYHIDNGTGVWEELGDEEVIDSSTFATNVREVLDNQIEEVNVSASGNFVKINSTHTKNIANYTSEVSQKNKLTTTGSFYTEQSTTMRTNWQTQSTSVYALGVTTDWHTAYHSTLSVEVGKQTTAAWNQATAAQTLANTVTNQGKTAGYNCTREFNNAASITTNANNLKTLSTNIGKTTTTAEYAKTRSNAAYALGVSVEKGISSAVYNYLTWS